MDMSSLLLLIFEIRGEISGVLWGEREGMLGVKIGLGFLNPPRFLRQELLTPFPGEMSLTVVLSLRGTKRRLRTSQESTSDRLGRAP